MASPTPTSLAHDAALQMLYAVELDGQDPAQVRAWFSRAQEMPPGAMEQAWALVDAVRARRERIEELIARHSHHWRLERIGVIDRCLLKLAIAEILAAPDAASAVMSINETLRMARRFSQPEIVGFLHGTLDAVAREVGAAA